MKLHDPIIITPRLLPGLQVDNAFISIEYAKKPGDEGRTRFQYYIDLPDFTFSNDDLESGCQGCNLQSGLETLLAFLAYPGDDLFPDKIKEWAKQDRNELECLLYDLEQNLELIQE